MLRRNRRENWGRRNEDEDYQRSPPFRGRNRRDTFHDEPNRDYYGQQHSPAEWRMTGNDGNATDDNFMTRHHPVHQFRNFDSPHTSHLLYSPYGMYSNANSQVNDYSLAHHSPMSPYNIGRQQVNLDSSGNFPGYNFGQNQNFQNLQNPFNTPIQNMSINSQPNILTGQISQPVGNQNPLIQSPTPEMSQAKTTPSVNQSPGPLTNFPAGNNMINRNIANIPPIAQFASPTVVAQNPFSVGQAMGNSTLAQIPGVQTASQNNNTIATQLIPMANQVVITGPLTDSQKSKIQTYQDRKKDYDQKFNNMVKLRKTDYPILPENAEIEYMPWRTKFLMQAQVHQMHEIYKPEHIPIHKLFPLPSHDDPSFEGRPEILVAAHDMYNAIMKYENQKFIFQGTAIAHAIEKHKTARLFVKPNNVNPIQIFKDLDSTFIQHNRVTKGECISVVWNLTLQPGERLAAFFARLDIECLNLSYMFNYKLCDEDRLAIIQHNIPKEYMQTYMSMLQQDKGIEEIKQSLIALEVASLRREDQVHSVRDFVKKSYDGRNNGRFHNRNSSPNDSYSRHNNYEERRSLSPGRFNDRSRNWNDYKQPDSETRSPLNQSSRYSNQSNRNSNYCKGPGSNLRGGREKSRSRSPMNGNGNYDRRSNDENRNYDNRKYEHNRPYRSPSGSSNNRRSYRSPSPGTHGRPAYKKVNFRANVAKDIGDLQQVNSNDDDDSGTDPDLRYNKLSEAIDIDEDTQKVMAAWNTDKVMGSSNVAMTHEGMGTIVGSSNVAMGGGSSTRPEVDTNITHNDIINWRRKFPTESEWMRSRHIAHIILRERVENATNQLKHKITLEERAERRQANRDIARIESDIGKKCIGAEKPQSRPFSYETAAQDAHKEVIRKHMANKSPDSPSTKISREAMGADDEAAIRADKRARRAVAAELRMNIIPNPDTLSLLSLASSHNPILSDNNNVTGDEEPPVIVGSVNMVMEEDVEDVEGESKDEPVEIEDQTETMIEIIPTDMIDFDYARQQVLSSHMTSDHYWNQIIPYRAPRPRTRVTPVAKVSRKFNIDEFRFDLCTIFPRPFLQKDYSQVMSKYPFQVTQGPTNRRIQIHNPEEEWAYLRAKILDELPECFNEITDEYSRRIIIQEWYDARLREEQEQHRFWFYEDIDIESIPSLNSPTSSDDEGPILPEGPVTPLRRTRDPDTESEESEETVVDRNIESISMRSHESMTSVELSTTRRTVAHRISKAVKQYLTNRGVSPDSIEGRVLIRRYNNTRLRLSPMKNYPKGIIITYYEWSLGFGRWPSGRDGDYIYEREIDDVITLVELNNESRQRHEAFYARYQRDESRKRSSELEDNNSFFWEDYNIINPVMRIQDNRITVFEISRYWERRCKSILVTWPNQIILSPETQRFRHYYSDMTCLGLPDGNYEGCQEMEKRIHNRFCPGDINRIRGTRDVQIPQVMYTTYKYCYKTRKLIDDCRCLECLLLHTAILPRVQQLEEEELCVIRCIKAEDHEGDVLEEGIPEPVLRTGVINLEKRPEFIAIPYDIQVSPSLAKHPRVYKFRYSERKDTRKEWKLYAELTDAKYDNVRYVMGDVCRYHKQPIDSCTCGICHELRASLDTTTMTYDPLDQFHYVWCQEYALRPAHILNSLNEHVKLTDWNTTVTDLRTAESRMQYDRERQRRGTVIQRRRRVRSRQVFEHAGITVYEVNNRIDPFAAQTNAVDGRRRRKKRVSDSGATKHMFHDKEEFTNYREVLNQFVKVADGKVVPVMGIGNVGPLKNVLHVPSLVYDLISESELDKEGKWSVCGNGVRTFYNRAANGQADFASVFLVAKLSDDNLYEVNSYYLGMENEAYNYMCYDALASKAEAIDILHKTMGHINVDRLQDLAQTGQINWTHESPPVNFRKYANPCVACALAKSNRQSHTKKIRVPLEPGSLFYVDVWGPCDTASLINENVYTIGFIDAATKRA